MNEQCGISYSDAQRMNYDDLKEANAALDLMIEKQKKAQQNKKGKK